jgi:hypothetical protein
MHRKVFIPSDSSPIPKTATFITCTQAGSITLFELVNTMLGKLALKYTDCVQSFVEASQPFGAQLGLAETGSITASTTATTTATTIIGAVMIMVAIIVTVVGARAAATTTAIATATAAAAASAAAAAAVVATPD